jgi:hypothetical protein
LEFALCNVKNAGSLALFGACQNHEAGLKDHCNRKREQEDHEQ